MCKGKIVEQDVELIPGSGSRDEETHDLFHTLQERGGFDFGTLATAVREERRNRPNNNNDNNAVEVPGGGEDHLPILDPPAYQPPLEYQQNLQVNENAVQYGEAQEQNRGPDYFQFNFEADVNDDEDEEDEARELIPVYDAYRFDVDEYGDEDAHFDEDDPEFTEEVVARFNILAELIPAFTVLSNGEISVIGICFLLGFILSLVGARVAGNYAGVWAEFLSWDIMTMTVISAGCNLIANVPVNGDSLKLSYYRLNELSQYWRSDRMPLPDDGFQKKSIITQATGAVAAAAPWVMVAFDNLSGTLTKIFLGVPLGILTLFGQGALALRGFSNYFRFDYFLQAAVVQGRREMLVGLRNLMSPEMQEAITDDIIARWARGETTMASDEALTVRNIVGNIFAAGSLPYSLVVGLTVYLGLSRIIFSTGDVCRPVIQLESFFSVSGITLIASFFLIGFGARFFLLSVSNSGLAHRVLSTWDPSLFDMTLRDGRHYCIETSTVKNPIIRKILKGTTIAGSSVIGFFSIGLSSGLALKVFFCNEVTLGNLFLSLAVGFGGSFGLNVASFYSLVMNVASELKRRLDTMAPGYDPYARFGRDFDDFLLRAAYHLTIMPPEQWARRYLVSMDPNFRGTLEEAIERGIARSQYNVIPLQRASGIYGNFAQNGPRRDLDGTITAVERTGQGRFFDEWRAHAQNPNGVRRRRPHRENEAQFEEEGAVPMQEMPHVEEDHNLEEHNDYDFN